MLCDGPPASRSGGGRLLLVVRLSSERAPRAVRQDCPLAKKEESPPVLLVVVSSERLVAVDRAAYLLTGAGALVMSENCPSRTYRNDSGLRQKRRPTRPHSSS